MKGPVALTTSVARASRRAPLSRSTSEAPRTRPRRSRESAVRCHVVGHRCARGFGVEHVLQHQPGVVRLAVDVRFAPGEPGAAQRGNQPIELVGVDVPPRGGRSPQRQRVVERDADPQGGERGPLPGVTREKELDRPAQMRARSASGCDARPAPRTPAAGRRTAGSGARRESTSTNRSRWRRRSLPRRRARRASPRKAASRAVAAPEAPPPTISRSK